MILSQPFHCQKDPLKENIYNHCKSPQAGPSNGVQVQMLNVESRFTQVNLDSSCQCVQVIVEMKIRAEKLECAHVICINKPSERMHHTNNE